MEDCEHQPIDSENSLETDFILNIHKTLLSFNYLEKKNQKTIVRDFQQFINRLTNIFQSQSLYRNKEEKRLKIIEILVKYLNRLHNDQIRNLIRSNHRDDILKNIERDAYDNTMKHLKKINSPSSLSPTKVNQQQDSPVKSEIEEEVEEVEIVEDDDIEEIDYNKMTTMTQMGNLNNVNMDEKIGDEIRKLEERIIQKMIEIKRGMTNMDREMERKMELRMKSNFLEIENQIKKCIRDSLTSLYKVENEAIDKMNDSIHQNKEHFEEFINKKMEDEMKKSFEELYSYLNTSIQDSVKTLQKMEGTISHRLDERMEEFVQDIYEKLKDNFKIIIDKNREINDFKEEINKNQTQHKNDMKTLIQKEFEDKLAKLSNLFQTNLTDILRQIEKQPQSSDFGTFNLEYNRDDHQIQLLHNSDVISSVKLNIKGMMGPKGPIGQTGKTPKIKNIRFSHDAKVIFIIEGDDENQTYEVESEERIPSGPQGPQGPKGEPGTVYTEMKLNDRNVLKVDNENLNNLIVMKSLCIGDNSHCLSEKSLAIGGGITLKQESLALGRNSQTNDMNSIALYGTTSGKNAFSYRAQNVEENQVRFGNRREDIEKFEIHSQRIVLDSPEIELKGKIIIQGLEQRIKDLENKVKDLQRRL